MFSGAPFFDCVIFYDFLLPILGSKALKFPSVPELHSSSDFQKPSLVKIVQQSLAKIAYTPCLVKEFEKAIDSLKQHKTTCKNKKCVFFFKGTHQDSLGTHADRSRARSVPERRGRAVGRPQGGRFQEALVGVSWFCFSEFFFFFWALLKVFCFCRAF